MCFLYRSQHELIFVFKSGKEAHRNKIQLGEFGDRSRSDVWNYNRASSLRRSIGEGNQLTIHPTAKPARGDLVLYPFLGSDVTVCRRRKPDEPASV